MPARQLNTCQKDRRGLRLLFLLLPILFTLGCSCGAIIWQKDALWEMFRPRGAEQELLGRSILQISREVLEDRGVQEEQIEEILQLTEVSFKKVLENYVLMPDWAMESMGASIDEERTSKSYGGEDMMTWLLSRFTFLFANPPAAILQPGITPGNCWPFRGSQGHVVIRLPAHIWPTAFTVWHISKAVSPSGEVGSAPREFTVFGVDEAMAETVLGTFTYDVHKEIAQTFYVQKELPSPFRYIKFQVQSNWGNPEYTCVYRVQVHGMPVRHNND